MSVLQADAVEIAAQVRSGGVSATTLAQASLAAIEDGDVAINSYTTVMREQALSDAAQVDAQLAAGLEPGPLAGVPFAAKNLFDIAGEVTLAGSTINRVNPPASRDAEVVARLRAAGAVLTGALNMDEYAYGFTTENSHYGPTRNPHDHARVAGGSSGGSAAAVAAGFVALALGSDTNGSVRVPAALCGVFGLKPTFGRLSRAGMFPFSHSLDHAGVIARSARDLCLSLKVLDPRYVDTPQSALRIATLGGYFAEGAGEEALTACRGIAQALSVTEEVVLADVEVARAAAIIITASEGAQVHRDDLRARAGDFDPMTRNRFLAGALLASGPYEQAQRFRERFREQVREVLEHVDVLLAPTTPFPAPLIGQRTQDLGDGRVVDTQSYLGVLTQPLSFIGLPVVTVPMSDHAALPLGVQLIGAPGTEATLLALAIRLEREGVIASTQTPVTNGAN